MEEQKFTCYGKDFKSPVVPITEQEWWEAHNDPKVIEITRKVNEGQEHLKNALPVWTPHCADFQNNHRSNADALLLLQRLMMDFDEKGMTDRILAKCMELQEAGTWKILLVEDSVRMGTHVLVELPKGMTPEDAQQRFSKDVGFQADPAVKDVARCIYMVPQSHVKYVHPDLFKPNPAVEVEVSKPVAEEPCVEEKSETEVLSVTYPTEYKGIPYEWILKVLEDQLGGKPAKGSRNNFIFSMACHLRYICNDDPMWIAQVLPTYGEDRMRWMNTIRSACQRVQSQRMSNVMQTTLRICEAMKQLEDLEEEGDEAAPPMPKDLPPLVRLLLSRIPEIYQAAVAHAIFPSLGAHLYRTTFRYNDNVEHEATLMCCLLADTGSGKSCVNAPIKYIMEDIDRRDAENRQRDKEWKQEVSLKGANKDKRKRPEGLVIQHVELNMTPAAFIQRLADAQGRFLYAQTNELDRFDSLKNSARDKSHFQIMCLAFDPDNLFGAERVGPGAVNELVKIRFNWNASATIKKGKNYFRSVLTDGPISRINFCTIPKSPIGAEMPVFGIYDDAFKEELKLYIDRLNNARGLVECPEVNAFVKQLEAECAEFARLSQNRVYWNLSFRALVIAFLKAMVLYVAHGEVWDQTMEDFVRWSLRYDLYCKMRFFGKEIEEEDYGCEQHIHRGPKNLLDLLPDVFTREEAQLLRQRQGIRQGSVKYMLANWKKRGYIEIHGEVMDNENLYRQQYAKTAAYLQKRTL